MTRESPEKVIAAYDQLTGLVADTKSAIGEVAETGYEKLNRCRALRGEHPFPDFEEHVQGIDVATNRVRITRTPQEPVPLPNSGVMIDRTATVTFNERSSLWQRLFVPDEVSDKLVVVAFHSPEDTSNVAVSTKGDAYFNERRNLTTPKQLFREGVTDRYSGYGTRAYALRADYATSFLGALGVTLFVADSLDKVHGIVSDTSAVHSLAETWKKLNVSREMHPKLARRLASV